MFVFASYFYCAVYKEVPTGTVHDQTSIRKVIISRNNSRAVHFSSKSNVLKRVWNLKTTKSVIMYLLLNYFLSIPVSSVLDKRGKWKITCRHVYIDNELGYLNSCPGPLENSLMMSCMVVFYSKWNSIWICDLFEKYRACPNVRIFWYGNRTDLVQDLASNLQTARIQRHWNILQNTFYFYYIYKHV